MSSDVSGVSLCFRRGVGFNAAQKVLTVKYFNVHCVCDKTKKAAVVSL